MKPSSKVFWGLAVAAALAGPGLAAPGLPVPGFQVVSPPRMALRPVAPRAMTPATRAEVERQRRDRAADRKRGVAAGIGGLGVYGGAPGSPDALVGEPPLDPYVIPGPPPRPNCIGPGPLIIEVGKPLPTPPNLPRIVYGTPTPRCPLGY